MFANGEFAFLSIKSKSYANDVPEEEENEHNRTDNGENEAGEAIR